MAENNIDVSQSYTIPLDSIDLAYLDKYLKSPRAERIPLWTKQKLDGESEYCQVLLVTKANKNEDCCSEPSETYRCHICNVNVPKMCERAHNASDQHDTMKKIYEKILESVTKQINVNRIANDENCAENTYYCAQCSKIIKIKNRQKHETSDYHVKFVKDFNIISDFYKILRDRKSDDSELDTEFSDVNEGNSGGGHETVFCEVNESRTGEGNGTLFSGLNEPGFSGGNEPGFSGGNETGFSGGNEAGFSGGNEPGFSGGNEPGFSGINEPGCSGINEPGCSGINEPGCSGVNVTRFSEEDEELTESAYSLVIEEECIEEDNLEIDRVKGNNDNDRNNVVMDASLSTLDTDDYSMNLSNNRSFQSDGNVANSQGKTNFEEYVKDMINKYDLKINLPVINGDFIWMAAPNGTVAQISRDHFHSYRALMNNVYCQLCNKWITQDTRNHDIFDKHVKKIFRPINDQFTRWVDTLSNHCVLCNEIVLKDSQHHETNDIHKNITAKTLCENCNIYVDAHKFDDHIKSVKHVRVLMRHNSIVDINNREHYCKICNQTMPKNALGLHVTSKLHLKKKTYDPFLLSNISPNKTNVNVNTNNTSNVSSSPGSDGRVSTYEYCEICKVKVPPGGMKIHVNGKPHKRLISQLNNENKTQKPKENRARVGEPVPSTSGSSATNIRLSDNSPRASSTHHSLPSSSNAPVHVSNETQINYDLVEFVNLARTKIRCKICHVKIVFKDGIVKEHMESRTHKEKASKRNIGAYRKLQFIVDDNDTGTNTKVKCMICGTILANVEKNIIEHMHGRKHLDAEIQLFEFHMITKKSKEYACEICGIQTADYFDHINSRTHILELMQKFEVDRSEMRKYVYGNHPDLIGHFYNELYKNILKHNSVYMTDEGYFYCGICQIKVGRVSEIDHVLGERHGSQIEKMDKLSSLLEQLNMANVITP
ncbi:hypothetical protein PYW08_012311 [Mythimna loreyi]|uniref:Uncharacterized protein n=1 Tax=Mythimna loreyi TaxID=667449 RepID=A0ACC2Q0C5_9NEOP|nr:hypothetical protein PYW08_012311 [Mythimna loreyi]